MKRSKDLAVAIPLEGGEHALEGIFSVGRDDAAVGVVIAAPHPLYAALSYLLETVPGSVVAAGYSFGAVAAVRVASGEPRVRRLVLLAPPPALLDVDALAAFGGQVLLMGGALDAIAPAAELERIASALPRATFAAIPDADHFFAAGLADVGRITATWLGGG
jgi:alpha/beta superfamily hydrolase